MRLWHATDGITVLVDVIVWASWGTAVGYWYHRRDVGAFQQDDSITRIRGWERNGRFWEKRLHIKRWKRLLPDAGDVFAGGFSKRHLHGRGTEELCRFAAETRRAELVHWTVPLLGPTFVLWNPPGLVAVMILYGLAANVPCLVTQRYNRARIARIIDRRS